MTIDEIRQENPGFVFIKQEKQWKGQNVYEEIERGEYEEYQAGNIPEVDVGGPPVLILEDENGETRRVLDTSESLAISRGIGLLI